MKKVWRSLLKITFQKSFAKSIDSVHFHDYLIGRYLQKGVQTMNKTELHAYGSELTAAVISEINIYDFTADEAFDEIYHQHHNKEYLIEAFEYTMDIFSEDDVTFVKEQYPATVKALNNLLPIIPENVINSYDMEYLM